MRTYILAAFAALLFFGVLVISNFYSNAEISAVLPAKEKEVLDVFSENAVSSVPERAATIVLDKKAKADIAADIVASVKENIALLPETKKNSAVAAGEIEDTAKKAAAAAPNLEIMRSSNDPLLKKLVEYENACGPVFGKMMVFTYMPLSEKEAGIMAAEMAARLKEFAAAGIEPIVAVEPVSEAGQPLVFADMGKGGYDRALRAYFLSLKAQGIFDSQLGIWMPIPEPNLDEWGEQNRGAAAFGAAFNRYGRIFKEFFPAAKLTVLLDNETYRADIDDTELASLSPYASVIEAGLADSFGLQGYPWAAPANEGDEKSYEAAGFLSAARAIEAAKILGVDSIWFSTGTFSEMFAGNKNETVYVEPQTRRKMLDGILLQVKTARAAGYSVMLSIFAEDKSDTDEATDFSYWNGAPALAGADGRMFAEFIAGAAKDAIPLAIYDSD